MAVTVFPRPAASYNEDKVVGPSSATDLHVAVFDGITGKLIKDSGFTIAKSVPSDAKFTDTTYSAGSGLALSGTTFRVDVPRVAESANHLPDINSFQLREYTNGTNYNLPSNALYHIYEAKGTDPAYGTQLALGMTTDAVYYRKYAGGSWGSWKSLINTDHYAWDDITNKPSNYPGGCTGNASTSTSSGKWTNARNFTIKDSDSTNTGTATSVDGSGAVTLLLPSTIKASITGNCSGSAGSVAWGNVTGKPSSYTPSSHTHSNVVIAGTNTQSTKTSDYALNGMNVRWFTQASKVPSQPTQYGFLLTLATSDNASENHQIWAAQADGNLYHRGTNGSTYTSPPAFKTLLDSSNYTNWCSPKADSAFKKLQNTYSGSVRTVTQTFDAYGIGMVVVTSYQGSSWGAGVWIVICYDGTTPGVATQVVNANTGAVVTVTGKTVSVKATGNIMIYALM